MKNHKVAILNFHSEHSNFGAILTAFALNKALNTMGYSAYNINYKLPWIDVSQEDYFKDFRERYIPETQLCETYEDFQQLNKDFDSFIVGSDQVFRPEFTKRLWYVHFLNFVEPTKRRIACSASFGFDTFKGDVLDKSQFSYNLKKFDRISVREDNAVNLLHNLCGCSAEHILDPVFFLNDTQWRELIVEPNNEDLGKLISYSIGAYNFNAISKLTPSYKSIRHICNLDTWLKALDSAEHVVTDSFHGCCFCLILGTPFTILVGERTPLARITSLLNTFKIPHEKILFHENSPDEQYILNAQIQPRDYSDLIKKEKQRLIEFLNSALTQAKEHHQLGTFYQAKLKTLRFLNITRFLSAKLFWGLTSIIAPTTIKSKLLHRKNNAQNSILAWKNFRII